ncbi:hypothetical protein Ngar_c04460 [Candidatus Nitrososphaera gargensis Ga9.2]|uniref:Winged helix-turn-helix transcriptional regulator n=1 Tax=Nitrososphaera gargensis (strain Ga9.2) TaxID=1237085 RepID=K0IF14_NITGG|nr:transcriptional regulator [Candidatus Nitrososphaera gargensis]AFU57393.1 hypothetical protein Ngar_c04460 [Candidatus Nitrososphaera gargensis Ga9.2]
MISTYPWKDGARFFIPGILLLVAAIADIPASVQQEQGYSSESLFMAVFPNGDALVEYDVSINNPLAQEIRIKLFGGAHINDLIVADYEDQLVDYDIGSSPNEIVLDTPGVENIRISYSTPDLANRIQGIWTFALNATTAFSVRLPPDSVLVDYEPIPAAIKIVPTNQPLLTFDEPGEIRVSYAIGVLGTEDQANIAIQLANVAIRETEEGHPGIILTGAKDLLQRAIVARDDGKFAEAESLAGRANDAAVTTGRAYEDAQSAIAAADTQIDQAASEGRDIVSARQLLEQANDEFAGGNYTAAASSAQNAIKAIGARPPDPQVPVAAIVAGAVAAAGGVGALVFLKMRKPTLLTPQQQKRDPPKVSNNNSRTTAIIRPPEVKEAEEEKGGKKPAGGVVGEPLEEEVSSAPVVEPGAIPDSQNDRSVLGRIVGRILEEKPHLRPEDQQVLKFLAEKEGAAFESEIRSKFQLPKTTIWRLVKRLEREELVEIRKAGGQNLIKLKFEDRMPSSSS